MGRIYVVTIAAAAVTVATDLIEITPADDKPVIVHSIDILQTSDLQDAQEEIIGLTWVRGHTTSGSGGSAPTPRPLLLNSTAAGFTAETMNTTVASAGTAINLHKHGWNVRIPLTIFYPPEIRPVVAQPSTLLVLRMDAAPADSITISGSVVVEEII